MSTVADLARIDDKLAKRIASSIRMLVSKEPGDVDAGLRGLGRILQKAGHDAIHAVAERIEHGGDLKEEEMKKIFDAGVETGIKRAEQMQSNGAGALRMPPAHKMAVFCHERINRLNDWEQNFVNSMMYWTRRGPLTPNRQDKLEAIYLKIGGKI